MKQSGIHSRYSAAELAQVKRVHFCMLSKDELAWSGVQINEFRLYEGTKAVRGGPNDLRLGVSSSDQKCETCGETRQCQGHFGFIKLSEPVFHYGFLKYIEKVLKCVCHSCFKLRKFSNNVQQEKFRRIVKISHPGKRLNELAKYLATINKCASEINQNVENSTKTLKGCGSYIPTKIYIKNYKVYVDEVRPSQEGQEKQSKGKRQVQYSAQKVKNILENISQQDAKLLGFLVSKPVDLLIVSFAVAPPQIRPSVEMNPEKRAQDDITLAYVKIISINSQLKKNLVMPAERQTRVDEMEKIVNSIMIKLDRKRIEKGQLTGRQKKTIKNIKSISERLKGKEGRFRQHLMGKRVDFSARSVVSPDSNLALDQLGVPQKVAAALTIPEQVTELNYDRIKKLCEEGKVLYFYKPSEDKKRYEDVINLVRSQDKSAEIEKYLNYGIVVERCLQNGDYVLFNRQPTLHRMSMMGHRVKILPYNTFRLNLSVCTPYNADFDGDEMNMHVPQSYETISEIKNIAHVPKQIVAPKNNAPVMGIVQDSLLGVYLFTMRDTFLTKEEIMNLVIWMENRQGKSSTEELLPGQLPMPAILKPQPLWTGKQVMSLIIPDKISLEIRKSSEKVEEYRNIKDVNMIIKKGEILSGALQKEVVGSGAGGLVHSIWLEIGPDATNEFITTAQRIVNNWLVTNSFSVGAADIVPDQQLIAIIERQSQQINKLYYDILNKYRSLQLIEKNNLHQRGKRVLDSFEYYVNINLNNKLNSIQKIVSERVSPYLNNIHKMITAKSKGSQTNLTQIIFLLGNQNIDGKRCPLGFSRRALPHFCKDDNSPQSRGFVFSSFYNGLKPHEFFFHSMGGRQGLSDTAVKTSRTGYIQRKLMKSLQDIMIKYDGTVRDSQNNLLQKMYGQDSFTAEYIEKHRFSAVELSEKDFQAKFSWKMDKLEDVQMLMKKYKYTDDQMLKLSEQYKILKRCRERLREILIKGKDTTEIQYYCPIKIQRLIEKIRSAKENNKEELVGPLYVYEQVDRILDECVPSQSAHQYQELLEKYAQGKEIKNTREFLKRKEIFEQQNGLELFRIHIRLFLASRTICEIHKLTKNCFNGLIEEIRTKYFQALGVPGQAIGAIAAQSIGQPTTQMTLNTFHLAGVSDKNVTLGVPRLQQLLDASKNIKTPNMTIFLKQKILHKDKGNSDTLTNQITKLVSFDFPERHTKDYLFASRIYYDPDPTESHIDARFKELSTERRRTPWVISLIFDMKKLVFKQPWNEILFKIEKHAQANFEVTQKVSFHDAETTMENPQLTLRCLELNDGSPGLIKYKKEDKNSGGSVSYFKFLNAQQNQIKELRIGGIEGVRSVKTSKKLMLDPTNAQVIDKKSKQNHEYVVFDADGTNLRACLAHDRVDPHKTYSNDVNQIYNILGIEAARQSFINEFKEIIKPYGIYINYRHLSVLADWMTMRGVITPVNRNGINRVKDVSVLRKASYEQTADILFSAAVFSEIDELKGVSQKIIFGQNVKIGTGNFSILIDRDRVKDFKTKGALDKKEDYEQKHQSFGFDLGDKTPIAVNTPLPYQRNMVSERKANQSNYGMSPGFTPHHDIEFSQPYLPGYASIRSPRIPGTPIMPGGYTTTPIVPTSPNYINSPGASSYLNQYKGRMSPHYYLNQGSNNSPSYSSIRNSQSPQYSSPVSQGQYSNSPVYTGGHMDSNRQFKAQQENDDDDEDQDDK